MAKKIRLNTWMEGKETTVMLPKTYRNQIQHVSDILEVVGNIDAEAAELSHRLRRYAERQQIRISNGDLAAAAADG